MKTLEQFINEFKEITGKDVYSFESIKGEDSNSLMFVILAMQEEMILLHERIKALEAK